MRCRASGQVPYWLRLAGCRKRPGSLRVQSCLSRRGSRSSRSFGSGFFRGFLRSGLFRCFLGCWLFGSGFLRSSFLRWRFLRYFFRRRLFRCCFFSSRLFRRYFFGRGFFRWRFFRRSFFSCYFFRWRFFGRGFFRCYFFSRRFFSRYFFRRGFLRSSFFSRSFFRSCHSFLLDHIAKITSRLGVREAIHGVGLSANRAQRREHGSKAQRAHFCGAVTGQCKSGNHCCVGLSVSPRRERHRTGTRSHGFRKSCVPFSGRSFRSSRGKGFPRSGTAFPGRSAWPGGWRCSADNP